MRWHIVIRLISLRNNIMVMKYKMPYEYLESGGNFEEYVVIHGAALKFKIISTWEVKNKISMKMYN